MDLVLHVGYHKTATTFLQQNVFAGHKNIVYLGMPWRDKSIGQFFRELKYDHDLDFDPSVYRDRFARLLALVENNNCNGNVPILVSLESLHCGADWFGRELVAMLDRLAEIFPMAKIILGIRNQKSYIVSNYAEYVVHGGKLSFREYLHSSFAFNCCLAPKLEYDKVIRLYHERFGKDHVYVYLQEELKSNANKEIARILEFVSIDTNETYEVSTVYTGLSMAAIRFVRVCNRFLAKDFSEQYHLVGRSGEWSRAEKLRRKIVSLARRTFRGRAVSPKSMMTPSHRKHIDNMYRQSNARLAELLQKNVETFGYVL